MMIKRITFLVIGLVLFVFSGLLAQPTFSLTTDGSTNLNVGDIVDVELRASSFTDILLYQMSLQWDPTILEFVERGDVNTTDFLGLDASIGDTPNNTDDGKLTLLWSHPTFQTVTVVDGTLVLSFRLKAICDGTTSVAFSDSPTARSVGDGNGQELNATYQGIDFTATGTCLSDTGGTDTGGTDTGGTDTGGTDTGGTDTGGTDTNTSTETTFLLSTSGTTNLSVGDIVEVSVQVRNFTDILLFQMSMGWDPTILEFVERGTVNSTDFLGLDASIGDSPNNTDDGKLSFLWNHPTFQTVTVADGTTLFTYSLRAICDGTTTISFGDSPTTRDVGDAQGNAVTTVYQSLTFNATGTCLSDMGGGDTGGGDTGGGDTGTAEGDFALNISNISDCAGESICVPVVVNGFSNVESMQFAFQYNTAILNYTGFANSNLGSGLTTESFFFDTGNNLLNFSWNHTSAGGVTLNNGVTAFELCFDLIGASGTSSNIEIVDGVPTPVIEVIANSAEVTYDGATGTEAGRVTILNATDASCDGNTGGGSDAFTLAIEEATSPMNSNYCVDVTARNFDNIASLQYTMTWNTAIMTFSNVQNPHPDLGFAGASVFEGSFNITNTAAIDNGILTFSWVEPSTNGITIDEENPVLYQVCFDIIGQNDQFTDISFSDTPTQREVIDGTPADITNTAVFSNGRLTIGEEVVEPIIPVKMSLGAATPAPVNIGNDFCVPLTVRDFTNITNAQFSVNYDATLMSFLSIQNINTALTGATIDSFDTTTDGALSFQWSNDTGVTLADNTKLFDICFNATAEGNPLIFFSDTPLVSQTTNSEGETIAVTGANITVPITPVDFGDDVVVQITSESGQPGDEVCVDFLAGVNFQDIVSMEYVMLFDSNVVKLSYDTNPQEAFQFALPGLMINNFNIVAANQINLSWFDNSLAGVDLDEGDKLYTICFDIVGECGSSTNIIVNTDASEGRVPEVTDGTNTLTTQFLAGTIEACPDTQGALSIDSNANITSPECPGDTTGAVNILVLGGRSPYTFEWSSGETTEDIENKAGGDYTVSVTDANGTVVTRTYTIDEPESIAMTDLRVNDVTCFGFTNGAIRYNVTGGTAPYSYIWSGGLSASKNQTGLSGGRYGVTITDDNGCSMASDIIEVNTPTEEFAATVDSTRNIACEADASGAIFLSASGGTMPYSYTWSDGDTTQGSRMNLAGGTYGVTVTDANNCSTLEESITIEELGTDLAIAIGNITDVVCNGDETGSIMINVSGGSTPYTYVWSDSDVTTAERTGLGEGGYSVTVTDANGCTVERANLTIGAQSTGLTVAMNMTTPISQAGGDGAIALEVSGGLGSYSYLWTGPNDFSAMTKDVSNLVLGGVYEVIVTDSLGCTTMSSITVNQPLGIMNFAANDISCSGLEDGSITFAIVGGAADYSVLISSSAGDTLEMQTITAGGTLSQSSLAAGDYYIEITDAEGVTRNDTVVISGKQALVLNDTLTINPVTNLVNCDGMIDITIQGGTMPYNYEWSNGADTEDLTGLCEGDYMLTVTDAQGCTDTFGITTQNGIEFNQFSINYFGILNEPDGDGLPATVVTNSNCSDVGSGSVILSLKGGQTPYSYEWTNSNNEVIAETRDILNLLPGDYTIQVMDANGVVAGEQTYTIGVNSNLASSVEILSNYNGFATTCSDSRDAILNINASSTDTPISYRWLNPDGREVGNEARYNTAGVGTYTAQATDNLGCTITQTIEVVGPEAMAVDIDATNISCFGMVDGEVFISVTGGIGNKIYSWSHNPGVRLPFASRLDAGNYTVTVTDANNCFVVVETDVIEPDAISVIPETTSQTDSERGTATAIVTGGTAPFSYSWSNGDSGRTINDLDAGLYYVTVEDNNGCTETFPIDQPAEVLYDGDLCLKAREVITPDGDGKNEFFFINCATNYDNQLYIFDRWGQLVFEMKNYDNTWNGFTGKGDLVPEGGYFWVFEYRDRDNKFQQIKGAITVLHREE